MQKMNVLGQVMELSAEGVGTAFRFGKFVVRPLLDATELPNHILDRPHITERLRSHHLLNEVVIGAQTLDRGRKGKDPNLVDIGKAVIVNALASAETDTQASPEIVEAAVAIATVAGSDLHTTPLTRGHKDRQAGRVLQNHMQV